MNSNEKTKGNYLKVIMMSFVIMAVSFFVYKDASALGTLLYRSEIQVYAGDSVDLKNEIDEEFINLNYGDGFDGDNQMQYTITYKWNEENPSPEGASLTDDGIVSTTQPGKIKVDVTFAYLELVRTETVTVNALAPENISGTYGKSFFISAYDLYGNDYTYMSENSGGAIEEYGYGRVVGFTDFDIYAIKSDGIKVKVAQVSVRLPELSKVFVAAAQGTKTDYPSIKNYTALEGDKDVVWSCGKDIVALDKDKLSALKTGKTEINAALTARNGDEVKLSCDFTVTNPTLSKTEMVIAAGICGNISVKGICDYSNVNWFTDGNGGAYVTDEGVIYAEYKGTYYVKVIADGKTLKCKVIVTDPHFNISGISGYGGYKKTLSIKGINKTKSVVSYHSSNKKVATVTKKGKVTCKKTGHSNIIVKADGQKIVLNVEVASVKGYKASRKAIAISNTKTVYSQAQRMSKGKYDCSSLVWRVYSKYGYYFGVKSGWAPTAADIGKWCATHHKVIAKKGVPSNKLLPGDLIFYSYQVNGRYKNISHVEMYTGLGMDVSASSSNNRVIHYDYYPSDSIVMITRPTK